MRTVILLSILLSTSVALADESGDLPSGDEPEDPGDAQPLLDDGATLPPNAPVLLVTDSPETADKLIKRGLAIQQGNTQHRLKALPTAPPAPLIPLHASLILDVYERKGHAATLVRLWPETPLASGKARLLEPTASEDGLDVPTRALPYVATWKIAAEPDTKPPRWRAAPALDKAEPQTHARQKLTLQLAAEPAPAFIQIDVKPQRGPAKSYTLALLPDSPRTSCDNHLALNDPAWIKQPLTLTLTYLDLAGNAAPAPGKPLRVTGAPRPSLNPDDLALVLCVDAAP